MTPDPFGYFRCDCDGWTDCAETDEGARPLYDQDTVDALLSEINTERALSFRNQVAELEKQRDELLAALEPFGAIDLVESRLPAEFAMLVLRARAAIDNAKEPK